MSFVIRFKVRTQKRYHERWAMRSVKVSTVLFIVLFVRYVELWANQTFVLVLFIVLFVGIMLWALRKFVLVLFIVLFIGWSPQCTRHLPSKPFAVERHSRPKENSCWLSSTKKRLHQSKVLLEKERINLIYEKGCYCTKQRMKLVTECFESFRKKMILEESQLQKWTKRIRSWKKNVSKLLMWILILKMIQSLHLNS